MRVDFAAVLAVCSLLGSDGFSKKSLPEIDRYVERHLALAEAHAAPRGIPISICLAQAMVESLHGRSPLATEANNHFGMKKGSTWRSATVDLIDDERDATGLLRPSKFRRYWSVEDSYIDYCQNLARFEVYRPLFSIPKTDYRRWAEGLRRCGYASSRRYAQLLIEVIEAGELFKFDQPKKGQIGAGEAEAFRNWRLALIEKAAEKSRERAPKKPAETPFSPPLEMAFFRFLSDEKRVV